MIKRVFLIVLDSFGIGKAPDAAAFGDEGSDTLRSVTMQDGFAAPNLQRLGFFNIKNAAQGGDYARAIKDPRGAYAAMCEASAGKDTTIGHWEMAGIYSPSPLPTYPHGFPKEIIDAFSAATGRGVLCNKPYSGTDVIKDYGEEHLKTGALIVYTSADSVFQIAAHEDVVPLAELYRYCEIAREILVGEHGVGRVIARPFTGEYPFTRTKNRHDFSLKPTGKTILGTLCEKGYTSYGVGKINDIFAGEGLNGFIRTADNRDGMAKTTEFAKEDWNGLCFTNLVDFDMVYGHRNDAEGYTRALCEFDEWLGEFMSSMRADDLLIITADHGCDPATPSTDHSREYVPLLVFGKEAEPENLGTLEGFDNVGKIVLKSLGIE